MLKQNMQTRQIVKIPDNIKVFYCKKKNIIIFKGPIGQKSLKIDDLLTISCINQELNLLDAVSNKFSNHEKKKLRSLRGSTVSVLKQLLIEITTPVFQKLNLVGVGYRAFPVEHFENHLLMLRLGYSHPIYFKIPSKTSVFCLKLTKLFVYGNSYQQITFTAARIRSNKVPEPYKGKGIVYENEKILLKEGKKI